MMTEASATQRSDEGIISLGTRNGMELAILKRTVYAGRFRPWEILIPPASAMDTKP